MNSLLFHIRSVRFKLSNSLRVHGFFGTLYRIFRYPVMFIKLNRLRRLVFSSQDTASVFAKIYETNWWGSKESVSGTGSTLAYTVNLRSKLPELFEMWNVRKVFDAPCGDFNWMRHVVQASEIEYLGADIVHTLIERNSALYQSSRVNFVRANVISDDLPNADLWICRDCLIHFSFNDILATFENFARSEINYLLTTTHINENGFKNLDIRTGDARLIDLFSHPFYLPPDYLYAIDDWLEPEVPRKMVLFSRKQVIEALPKMKAILNDGITIRS